jgi:hypothetical protein
VGEDLGFSELRRIDPPAPLLPFNMRSATGVHNQELVGAPDQGVGSSGSETESLAVGRPLESIQHTQTGAWVSSVWGPITSHLGRAKNVLEAV